MCIRDSVSIGLSILFNMNASSGGLDIVAKIMNKYLHIELGKAMSISGMCVALSSALIYDKKAVVLSVLGTYFNGIVLDHITAGKALQVYHDLELDKLDCSVAILQNVKSSKMGKKDILKIDKEYDVNLDVLGYIDPDITVSIIKDGQTVEKKKLALPKKLINVKKCKNPRCITSTEPGIVHIFKLADEKNRIYRCIYCEADK